MAFPKPPEWLEEWEAEYGFGQHPEHKPLPALTDCPECLHSRHWGVCRTQIMVPPAPDSTANRCVCPAPRPLIA